MPHSSLEEALKGATDTLRMAQVALEDFRYGTTQSRRTAGLMNTIVWARNVTQSLHQIRTFKRDQYNEWYEPFHAELEADAGFLYVYDLRNQVLKEAFLGPTVHQMFIHHLNTNDLPTQNPPPNATGFFVGDKFGGSGWNIVLPDGETEKVYVELPSAVEVDFEVRFVAPTTGKGRPPPDEPINDLLIRYVAYLKKMVEAAYSEFSGLG
jgi:hypothetical protein